MTQSIVHTPAFQSFLSVHNPARDKSWDEVKERVTKYCQVTKRNTDERFLKLSLGLAKYDLNGAPSNWNDEYSHEKTIYDWATDLMEKSTANAVDLCSDEESEETSIDSIIAD